MGRPLRRAPNYDRKLTRRIVLADGTKLVTLRDAANVLLDAANARSGVPDYAIRVAIDGDRVTGRAPESASAAE